MARLRWEAVAIGSGQPLAELSLHVVNERFENTRRKGKPTGNRQAEILLCEPGEPMPLKPEPNSPADKNTIIIVPVRGVQLGYIATDQTSVIHNAVAQGAPAARDSPRGGAGRCRDSRGV